MTCAKCGTTLSPESTYCENCGEHIATDQPSIEQQIPQQEEASTVEQVEKTPNETVEKITAVSKSYWQYFLAHLKAPTQKGMDSNHSNTSFAIINAALISIFFALTLFAQLSLRTSSMFGLSFTESFIPGLVFMLLLIAITTGGLFLAIKIVFKSEVDFKALFVKFGGVLPLPVALSVAAFISGLIGISELTSLFIGLLFLTIFALMILTYQSYRKPGVDTNIDPLYGLVGLFAIVLILLSVISSYMLAGVLVSMLM